MKYFKNTLIWHGLAVAIGLGMLCPGSFAQEAIPASEGVISVTSTADATAKEKVSALERTVRESKVDIEFVERTKVTDFLDNIQDQVSTPLNIVVSRDAYSIMIPPMRLKNVSVQAALNAATSATESELNWHFGDDFEVINVMLDIGYASDSSDTIQVVNASEILEGTEEASLLSAIEIGLEMRASSERKVTIKLHKETKLLFIKGVYDDIKVVMQIVEKLGGEPWPQQGSGIGGGVGGGVGGGSDGEGGVF